MPRVALVTGAARGSAIIVSPGWIDVLPEPLAPDDQAQHPVGRVGESEDVVVLVDFLLSPESGFITGKLFIVDGSMTRKMIYR